MDAEQRLSVSMRSDRQQRFKIGSNRTAVGKMLHQSRNRRCFKQAADRNLNIKARTNPADQTRRKQRMAPKRKKVLVNPNSLNSQNLRKQSAQQLLLRRARQTTNPSPHLRRWQRSTIQLPVRRQRKTINNNNR